MTRAGQDRAARPASGTSSLVGQPINQDLEPCEDRTSASSGPPLSQSPFAAEA
jgi:hypothetical protein